jgi:hypothetical protein
VIAERLQHLDEPGVSMEMLIALSLNQPVILLAIAVAVGIWAAPRAGLSSLIADRAAVGRPIGPPLRNALPAGLIGGVVAGIGILVIDAAFRPLLDEAALTLAVTDNRTIGVTLAGIFYGGITEELLLRWGLVSFLAWLGMRIFRKPAGSPGSGVMWVAIVVAAVVFGVLHLPAVATVAPLGEHLTLTTPLVLRVILLNAFGGLVFGWLFWRRNLEAAMSAHAVAHLVFTAVAWTGIA